VSIGAGALFKRESRIQSFRILLTPLTYIPAGDPLLQVI
jgi:hypothetical protein